MIKKSAHKADAMPYKLSATSRQWLCPIWQGSEKSCMVYGSSKNKVFKRACLIARSLNEKEGLTL